MDIDTMQDVRGPFSPSRHIKGGPTSPKAKQNESNNESIFAQSTAKIGANVYGKLLLPRKEANWLERYRKKELLDFPRSLDAKKSQKVVPYYLLLRKVTGILIPTHMESINRENIYFRIQLSFFDIKARKFFGRTCVDDNFPIADIREGITIEQRPFVFYSTVHDDNCIGVVEYVVMEKVNNVVVRQFSVGWTTLNIFGTSYNNLPDVNDHDVVLTKKSSDMADNSRSTQKKSGFKPPIVRYFFRGSPRALLFIDFSRPDWASLLPRADNAKIWYELFTYNKLKHFLHLFRENEIIKQNDMIPGFPSSTLTDGDNIDDYSDDNNDNNSRLFKLPLNPKKIKYHKIPSFNITVSKPIIHLPSNFEDSMLWSLRQTREGYWAGDSASIKSITRQLCIGVHNGLRFVKNPITLSLQNKKSKKKNDNITLEYRGDIEIHDILCDMRNNPYVAISFELVYIVNWNSAEIGHPSYSTITAGWTLRMLGNSDDLLFNGNDIKLCLQRGVGRSLNNNRVFGWADADEILRNNQQNHNNHDEKNIKDQIWLNIRLESPELDEIQTRMNALGIYTNDSNDDDSSSGSEYSESESQSDDNNESEQGTMSKSKIYRAKSLRTPKNKNYKNIGHDQNMIPKNKGPKVSNISVRVDTDSDNNNNNEFEPIFSSPKHIHHHNGPPQSPYKDMLSSSSNNNPNIMSPNGKELIVNYPTNAGNNLDVTIEQLPAEHISHGAHEHNNNDMFPTEVNIRQELNDPFKGAEFSIVLKKFSQPHEQFLNRPIRSVMFGFTFGQELAFVSDRIPLLIPMEKDLHHNHHNNRRSRATGNRHHHDNNEEKLHSLNEYHSYPFNVMYRFQLQPHHHRTFIEYLYQGNLTINVWDGDSLFHIGEAKLPLRAFLRQGSSVIQKKAILDVTSNPLYVGSIRDQMKRIEKLESTSSSSLDHNNIPTENLFHEGEHCGKIEVLVAHRAYRLTSEEEAIMNSLVRTSIPSVNAAVFRLQSHQTVNKIGELPNPDPLNIGINSNVSVGKKVKAHLMVEGEHELASTLHGLDSSLFIVPRPNPNDMSWTQHHNKQHIGLDIKPSTSPRKIRMKPISMADALAASYGPDEINEMKLADKTRVDDLRKIKSYRNQKKVITIPTQIRESITQYRTIFPSFGQMTFFEVAFTNPFPKRSKFIVHISDPKQKKNHNENQQNEMSVVTDVKEWTYLKRQYGLNTPTKINMFYQTIENDDENDDKILPDGSVTIVLNRKETVYIPFKFQSFEAGRIPITEQAERKGKYLLISDANALVLPRVPGVTATPTFAPINKRNIQIEISRCEELLAQLDITVDPKNFPIDRLLNYHYWSDRLVEQDLYIPTGKSSFLHPTDYRSNLESNNTGYNNNISVDNNGSIYGINNNLSQGQANMLLNSQGRIVKARCSNDDIAFEFISGSDNDKNQNNNETKISFKFSGVKFPEITRVYFCLYTDEYSCNLFGIYEILLHAHLHCQLDNVLVGQLTPGSLLVPALDRKRNVKLYASSSEVTFEYEQGFRVEPHKVGELRFHFRTKNDGNRSVLVHMVDKDTHELLLSWIILAKCMYPRVTQKYKVKLRVGQGSNKNFDWGNKYNRVRQFYFDSSNPDMLTFNQNHLTLTPHGKGVVHVTIQPKHYAGNEIIYVFVNDDKRRTEECLQFNVDWMR